MKFLQKLSHTPLVFFYFLYLLFLSNNILAKYEEGIPYIQKISIKNFEYKNNNYSVVQNKNGIFYIGGKNEIIEYNGTFQDLIPFKGVPRFVLRNDTIYVAGCNEFGILAHGENNKTVFISLNPGNTDFGQIEYIAANDDAIFLCSKNKLFQWGGGNLSVIDSSEFFLKIFDHGNTLILFSQRKGLLKYQDNKFETLINNTLLKQGNIIDILPYNDKFLIKPEKKRGFILLDNGQIKEFNTEADEFLEKNQYTKGVLLSNGTYAFGTKDAGIVLVNKNGEIINFINQFNNLGGNLVLDLFIDQFNNLLVLHPNELSLIKILSPYSYFDNSAGFLGAIGSIIRHNNDIYIGTSSGVYLLSNKQTYCSLQNKFYKITGINCACEKLYLYNKQLFALTSEGIFKIRGNNSSLSYKEDIPGYFVPAVNSGKIYVARANKVGILKFERNNWKNAGEFSFPYQVENIIGSKSDYLWINTIYDGLFTIPLARLFDEVPGYKKYILPSKIPGNYTWSNLYHTSNGPLFACSGGVFLLHEDKQGFMENPFLGVHVDKNSSIYPVVEDQDKNLWTGYFSNTSLNNKKYIARFNENTGTYHLEDIIFDNIKNPVTSFIYPENSGIVWFVGEKGIVRYDPALSMEEPPAFNTLIRNIRLGNDSVIYLGDVSHFSGQSYIPEFSATFNKVSFEFGTTDYLNKDYLLYQHLLEGFDQDWSDWSKESIKEYTHLPKGGYTFRVRAKNISGSISSEADYKFKILPNTYARWWAHVLYMFIFGGLILFVTGLRTKYLIREKEKLENLINKRTKELALQKEKTDHLMANMLPKDTALIDTGKAETKKFAMVTVLFSDIQGFTKISEELNPEVLIDELDKFFLHFDSVVEKYNIEKIKTIGDAYMCAGGIPVKNRTNPVEVVLAAIEMQYYMKNIRKESPSKIWSLRIGIDTGPVIAGVVGRKKISYDIWGSTVNTASRMESSGEVDKINITGNTFMLINDFFICQYRGKMPIKNKGEIDMYFVESIRPKLSVDLKGIEPNHDLKIQLQLLRLSDLEELVLTKLEEGLPKNLYYHNLKHTVDVYTQVELIGKSEDVSEEDLLILRTAALLHDFGHTIDFDTHEEEGVMFAKKILPDFLYTEEQIEKVSELIMATKMPPNPKTLLEKIICDADLDYLGRIDFIPVSRNLFRELHERDKINSENEWNNLQIKFIQNHQYFTKTARRLRDVNKNKQLGNIRKLVDNE